MERTVKRTQVALAALIIGGAALAPCVARAAEGDADSTQQFSKASQAIYTKVSESIIHVKLDRSAAALLPPDLRKEFDEWLKQQPAGGAGGGAGPKPGRDKAQGPGGDTRRPMMGRPDHEGPGSSSQPAFPAFPGFGMQREGMLRKFLEMRAQNANEVDAAKYRKMAAGVDLIRGGLPSEAVGLMIDAEGNAIVLGAGLRDAQKDTVMNVTGPDGKETTAKLVGNQVARGIAVIKLESASVASPIGIAEGRPSAGDLMMCVSGSTAATGWITVPGKPGKKSDDRFAVYGAEERSSIYLFNADGKLAAMGFDRYAMPVETLSNDVKWIVTHQADLKPRQLGVKYDRVPMDSPLRTSNTVLGKQAAVVVTEVIAGSLAEQAGVQKGDLLVSIDSKPLWQIGQILMDLATRTGKVPVVVIRENKEVTLDLPLTAE